ncbi:hypothetical protein [Nocardia jiangxiensis]|uniref:hypothetical protein n=1 Tax=Nocardia jiangxiensis TaxID=282685 RepID=UPI00146B9000|nr:hypothetical protein [Nocardia jiangxiensis]
MSRSDRLFYIELLMWANEQQTDGFVMRAALKHATDISRPAQAAQRLVKSGALEEVDEGWIIVRFFDDQLSSEEVTKRSEMSRATTERNRRHKAGDHTKCDPKRCRALLAVTSHDTPPVTKHYTKLNVTSLNDTKLDETSRDETTVREVNVDVKFEESRSEEGTPPTDQPHLAFGHHPDDSAPGGALSPEDVLWSAPADVLAGVDAEGPVVPAISRSDDDSGAEGTPDRAALVFAFSRANEEVIVKQTRTGVELRLSKQAWDLRNRLEPADRPLWISAAREFAYQIALDAKLYNSAKINAPEDGEWPVTIDGAAVVAWVEKRRPRVLQHCMDIAETWWRSENR